jgi:hypothetical protein
MPAAAKVGLTRSDTRFGVEEVTKGSCSTMLRQCQSLSQISSMFWLLDNKFGKKATRKTKNAMSECYAYFPC